MNSFWLFWVVQDIFLGLFPAFLNPSHHLQTIITKQGLPWWSSV